MTEAERRKAIKISLNTGKTRAMKREKVNPFGYRF